jgi:lipopolysaccharide/colanic/teichoic acid biosynthesis glycosyltransferase
MERGRVVRLAAKRALDVAGAAGGLVALSPLLCAIAAVLAWTQGRPILFRQTRPGRGGRPFTILKFRTMRAPRADEVWHATDEQRLTPFGRFLRDSSLDELPELYNVLRGDMSLVGPRPLLMEYLERYTPEQRRRHDMRPGMTGWAQINGRNTIAVSQRLAHDVWYVDHWSLRLDLAILVRTVGQVVRRRDVALERVELDDIGLRRLGNEPGDVHATGAGDGGRSR